MATKLPKSQVVAFANQKGGSGKTTSVVNCAGAFAKLGYSVCVTDVDSQTNVNHHLGVTNEYLSKNNLPTIADIYLKKRDARDVELSFGERFSENGGDLRIIPGHSGANAIEARLNAENQIQLADSEHSPLDEDELKDQQRFRLKSSLDTLRDRHDLVFIDTPPDLGFLMTTALIAADWYIIPVFPSAFDLKGLEKLSQTVDKIRRRYNPNLRLGGVILGNYDKSTKLDKQVHEHLIKKFGKNLVFENFISRTVRNREATFKGLTIFEYAPEDAASENFLMLAAEMLKKRQSTSPSRLPKIETDSYEINDNMGAVVNE